MRVLVIKMSSLGDIIHTLPSLTDAAARIPGISFDWVVEEAFAEVPAWHRAVDRVIPVALRRWRRRPWRDFRGSEWKQARARLGRVEYDAVVDAQGLLKSAFIGRLVRGPRYGMDRHSARESLAALSYHHPIPVPSDMHAVERSRMLFARALNYSACTASCDYGLGLLAEGSADDDPPAIMFLHGSARSEKLWPTDHWRTLACLATERGYGVWLPWGNESELARAQAIVEGVQNAEVLPRSSLSELAARLVRAEAAVAVDTGLGHLAAALGRPCVSLYGPTRVSLVGTYGIHQVHLQSSSDPGRAQTGPARMAAITADAAWDAVCGLLTGSR